MRPQLPNLRTSTQNLFSTPKRTAIAVGSVGAALAIALGVGWGMSAARANEWASTSAGLQSQLDQKKTDLNKVVADRDDLQSQVTDAESQRDDLQSREAAVKDAETKLAEQQKALDDQTKQVEASQMTDGLHVVGTDLAPGVYSTTNTSNCYYAWKTGTGSDADIVDNNIVSGPATVTLKAGDTFETNRCGTWNKVG